MTRYTIVFLAGVLLCSGCKALRCGSPTAIVEQSQEDIYIPTDLDDCFVQLKNLLNLEDIEEMRMGTEDDMNQYHFSLGMWMRNNWGLWRESRLAQWFNAQGIKHPDDMSGMILDSFWRHLNDKPINLDDQVKYYQDYWKKQETGEGSVQTITLDK